MKFFLDENFPKSAAKLLVARGHETLDVRGTDKEGLADTAVFRLARESQAVLLTTDKDFFHTIPYLFLPHAGVVVITLRRPNRASILAKLEWLLDHVAMDRFAGRVFLMRDTTWRSEPRLDIE